MISSQDIILEEVTRLSEKCQMLKTGRIWKTKVRKKCFLTIHGKQFLTCKLLFEYYILII